MVVVVVEQAHRPKSNSGLLFCDYGLSMHSAWSPRPTNRPKCTKQEQNTVIDFFQLTEQLL